MIPYQVFDARLVAEPELRYTSSGKPVVSMRVAVNDYTRGSNGQWEQKHVLFFGASVWDGAERVAQTVQKGSRVWLRGKLTSREFERKDGSKGTTLELVDAHLAMPVEKDDAGGSGWGEQPPF